MAVDYAGSGAVYTTGHFTGTVDFDPGGGTFNLTSAGGIDIFISKLDGSGNFICAKAMGGTGGDYGLSIALDALGHVYLAGYFISPSISLDSTTFKNADNSGLTGDVFIAKLDAFTVPVVEIKTHQITIYPNPVTDELTIEFDESEFLNVEIRLYNILGEVAYLLTNEIIDNQLTIDISSLPAAIYFMEIEVDGFKLMKKILKE